MDTVVVVYTSMGGLINTMKKELSAALPDCRIVNIADDSLIREVVEHGRAILHQRFFQFLSVLHAQVDFLSGQKINIFKLLVFDVFHQHFHSIYPISEAPEYARSGSMCAVWKRWIISPL